MADFTVRYADFKGGDFGLRDPAKADADTWTGLNVYPYESGLLGVRAGIKQLPVTGLPTHPAVPGPYAFFALDTNLLLYLDRPYQFPLAGGAATSWVALSTPTVPMRFVVGSGLVYALTNGVLWKYASPSSVAAITTPAPLSHIVRWGYNFVGIDANRPWRIWFSEVSASGANFDSWPANNFLDVGNNEALTALNPIFNTLYAGKRDLWYAISGVLGTLASVREVVYGNGPVDPRLTTVTTDNRIIYWPVESSPAWFNGERVSIVKEQDVGTRSTPFTCDTVIATPTGRRIALANSITDGTEILSWADSAWTRHRFGAKLAGLVPAEVRDGDQFPEDVIYGVLAPTTVGDPVVVVSYHHQLNRPGHVDDQYAAPHDLGGAVAVHGEVSLPSYWEPIGRQVRVRTVIVQFRKWACGVPNSMNEIEVRLDAHGRYGGGELAGNHAQWVEPCTRASSDGSDDSWRINVGDQGYGNGFQLHFTKLMGVALREVIVLCDVRTERA